MDFWHLHHRLGPPLPRPHVAYLATVGASDPTKKNIRPAAGSVFLDFHLAGVGSDDDNNDELRYSLVDRRCMYRKYVGTCNGVILLAQSNGTSSSSILLFNPAIAGGEVEVELELPACAGRRYRVVGFGYGPSSRLHKLLLAVEADDPTSRTRGGMSYRAKELFVYTLGGSASHPRLRSVMSELDAKISDTSVYLTDGKIYLLAGQSRVLAFDVDDETVTAIDLPDGTAPLKRSELMEVSGLFCVATGTQCLSLWLLMADHRWERLGEEFRWRHGDQAHRRMGLRRRDGPLFQAQIYQGGAPAVGRHEEQRRNGEEAAHSAAGGDGASQRRRNGARHVLGVQADARVAGKHRRRRRAAAPARRRRRWCGCGLGTHD
ncbi:hypothetical protein HU200_063289 [Digitaria exilis]|uniref:F-box associated beta-propeller type 3 domain-containing protein n=1 Tax=Digitaria exilis TaxID=1010633 RepID=A0A835A217_9POAL|nr:hypothetical protein HU200_063289 [Digitaria exilis]